MVLKRCLFLIAGNKLSCVSNDDDLNSIKNQFLLLAYGANRHIKLEEPKPYQEFDAIATLFGENGYLKHIRVSSTFEYVNKHFKTIQPLINAVLETSEHNNNVFLPEQVCNLLRHVLNVSDGVANPVQPKFNCCEPTDC
jgi:hypothetical protein